MDVDPDAGLEPGRARRLKWLFALLLCPACFLGFGWSLLGVTAAGAGAALWAHRWVALPLLAVGAACALLGLRAMRRRSVACSAEAP